MNNQCPICKSEMNKNDLVSYIDYFCWPIKEDHHYSRRIRGTELQIEKIRISTKEETFYLKLDYSNILSEIWTKPNGSHKVQLDHLINVDFTDLNKLEEKLKTYILFS
jgi:hypothetical protein